MQRKIDIPDKNNSPGRASMYTHTQLFLASEALGANMISYYLWFFVPYNFPLQRWLVTVSTIHSTEVRQNRT